MSNFKRRCVCAKKSSKRTSREISCFFPEGSIYWENETAKGGIFMVLVKNGLFCYGTGSTVLRTSPKNAE